jgi:hypothetical protein
MRGDDDRPLTGGVRCDVALWPRAQRVGADGARWRTVALSLLNSLAASCAAFLLGVVCRWIWW